MDSWYSCDLDRVGEGEVMRKWPWQQRASREHGYQRNCIIVTVHGTCIAWNSVRQNRVFRYSTTSPAPFGAMSRQAAFDAAVAYLDRATGYHESTIIWDLSLVDDEDTDGQT